ncbi:MAG: Gfo/Idh/MocA family oxidoreductase [Armatimonadota bacterium]|nr:Gfo/Idh/MocA family oxidoreductase [Armatimonadota bacterium]
MPDAVRLGIVGCGGIAQAHLKGYETLVQEGYDRVAVTAVCDLNRESAEAAAERVGASMGTRPATYRTAEEMVEAGAADAADICLPHAYHHTAGVTCLEGGVHIMVEKPVGITVKATRRLMEAADGTDLVIAGAEQIRRCLPARATEWAINDQRMYGEPTFFTHEVFSGNPPDRSRYAMAWRALKLLGGGGNILDGGAHFADMVQHVFGPVDEVFCTLRTIDDTTIDLPDVEPQPVDVEDYWTATLRWESGLVGHWGWSPFAWGQKLSTRMYYGTEGSFSDRQEWMHPFQFGADLTLRDGSETPYEEIEEQYLGQLSEQEKQRLFPYGITDGIAIECWDFIEAVAEGRSPEIDAAGALQAKSLCFALYESAEANAPVKVADVREGRVSAYQDPIDEYWGI